MKFTDGYWMNRKQYQVNSPAEVFNVEQNDDELKLFAPYQAINSRNDQLNIGGTEIKLFSPIEGIIGVRLTHFRQKNESTQFEINREKTPVKSEINQDSFRFSTGKLGVNGTIGKQFELTFDYDGQVITESEWKAQGEITDTEQNKHFMREQLTIDLDEFIYGLGERFTPFIKNGQSVDIWNQDGGTGSEQAYKNIPFYISNKGYGVFVNNTGRVSYEIASENVDRVQFSVPGESLEYYIIAGPTLKKVLGRYTKLTGKIGLPPAWSFGLWLSTSFTTDYSEKVVMEFIDGMAQRHIPLDVFHFDCFWQKDFRWSELVWNDDVFPDPKTLLARIHQRDIKVCVWINPYISQQASIFDEGLVKGFFVKRSDGNVWQWDMWQPGCAFVDFTNPDAVNWYKDKLRELLKMGVDCFKTDFGERIPVNDANFFDKSDPESEHNYYTYQYNKAVYEVIQEEKGPNEAVVFARSATVGSQKYPVHWGGDNLSRYASMADSLRGGLSFLVSGFGFWSHDIGGFEQEATADIYKRWSQFGLLSSHSRYHGSIQYRVPWVYDAEAVENTRKYVNLKLSLMPYLYTQAVKTCETGVPLMRPIFLEYTTDPNTAGLDKEYMLGESILVAPIFNDRGDVNYYLPQGKWTSILNNKVYEIGADGQWQSDNYDELNLPVLVRENSIIVRNQSAVHASYDYSRDVQIHLFQLKPGIQKTRLVNTDGKYVTMIVVTTTDHIVSVTSEGLNGKNSVILHQGEKQQSKTLSESGSVKFEI